jgi:Flp pilus assembly protein TadD
MTDGTAPRTSSTPAHPTPATAALPETQGAQVLANTRREFERARLAMDMGKAQTALTLLLDCVAVEPDHPEYLGLFGLALCRCGGDPQRARQACQRAVADRPEDASLHVHLAMVLETQRDRDGARRAYETALQIDPENTLARNGLDDLSHNTTHSWLRSVLRLLRR